MHFTVIYSLSLVAVVWCAAVVVFFLTQYVIKKLNLRTSSKRERRAAEQEAQLLSQLKHPNIVTYRESWEGEDYQLYIVMGFCEGGDLYHRLKQQKGELLPERQVVEWFVQIAMALQVAKRSFTVSSCLNAHEREYNQFLQRLFLIRWNWAPTNPGLCVSYDNVRTSALILLQKTHR